MATGRRTLSDAIRGITSQFSLRREDKASEQLELHAAAMRELQQEALTAARQNPSGADGKITMLDFYKAAHAIITRENAKLQEAGVPKEEHIKLGQLVDFRGQRLEGFEFRREHLDPTGLAQLYEQHDFTPGFFDEFERGLSFNHAEIINSSFIPATTLDAMYVDRDSQVRLRLENVTFNSMSGDDRLILGSTPDGTPHQNLHFTNIKDGIVILADNAKVEGITGSGAAIKIEMGRNSLLRNFTTEARPENGEPPATLSIVDIQAAPGATIEHADLSGTTVAPGSSLRGTIWNNVTLAGASLAGVDLSVVQWNGQPVTFENLRDAGVADNQLPTINGQHYGALEPPGQPTRHAAAEAEKEANRTPQQLAMDAAKKLAGFGITAASSSFDGENPNASLPVTPEAAALRARENQQFAESAAALAARNNNA
jgi:uncharacterized protein YjbI with pentapeptide repeats